MNRLAMLLACCVLLGACTVVDAGVGRGARAWPTEFGANCYAEYAWPANNSLLAVDIVGGSNAYTLISADVWRLLHLELGLLGVGVGLGPLQAGAGVGLYAPHAPSAMMGDNPFHDSFDG